MPWLKLPSTTLYYGEFGSGQPLLLLHANPGDSRDYEAVIPALAQHYRVLAVDWPGYGQSPLPEQPDQVDVLYFYRVLAEFIDALSLSPVLLIGNSLGGNAAARLAIEQPERVRGLVLVSPGGFTRHNPISRRFCQLQGSSFSLTPHRWASMYLKCATPVTEAMLERAGTLQATQGRVSMNRALWRSFSLPEHDLQAQAGSIRAPTLLVFGSRDPAIPANKDGRIASRCMPGAKMTVLPCGHVAYAEVPTLFLEAVLPFLAACLQTEIPSAAAKVETKQQETVDVFD